jgi:NADH dehydrogenase (ubiquinone) Fe-S protein 1
MVNVFINGKNYNISDDRTIIQGCKEVGIEIPRFCYHEKLSIAGNCRMCLVEVEKSLKPVASCAMPVVAGMRIKTNSVYVKKAREGVMEFLLLNHPLDCPICDQGGECDLQDQAMVFGSDRGRYYELKRSVEDKNLSPFIKTIMTRCIHCTRCVRFLIEIAGKRELGLTGRGNTMEINTFVNNLLDTEISGNVIDLCPVGALTSKPNAFKVRSWELRTIESIDIFDSFCSNIGVQVRNDQIFRIIPILNEAINEEWITDKIRFFYDGLKRQRILYPLIRVDNFLITTTWKNIFPHLLQNFYKDDLYINVLSGATLDMETLVRIRNFFCKLENVNITLLGFNKKFNDFRSQYICNVKLQNIIYADVGLIVGVNVRMEVPLLNIRFRNLNRKRGIIIYNLGVTEAVDNFFKKFGNSVTTIYAILEGRHWLCTDLVRSKNSIIFLGEVHLNQELIFFELIQKYLIGCFINVINIQSSAVGFYDLNIKYNVRSQENLIKLNKYKELTYICGADEFEQLHVKNSFVIYQGHHGEVGAQMANVVLPSMLFTEKSSLYMNVNGILQKTREINNSGFHIKLDWQIITALEQALLQKQILINTINKVRLEIFSISGYLLGKENSAKLYNLVDNVLYNIGNKGIMLNRYLVNFYLTDIIVRSSKVMGLCYRKYELNYKNYK